MDNEDNILKLTKLCQNFGAEPEQAKVMALQLDKRAKQLTQERDMTYLEALDHLLKIVVEARNS